MRRATSECASGETHRCTFGRSLKQAGSPGMSTGVTFTRIGISGCWTSSSHCARRLSGRRAGASCCGRAYRRGPVFHGTSVFCSRTSSSQRAGDERSMIASFRLSRPPSPARASTSMRSSVTARTAPWTGGPATACICRETARALWSTGFARPRRFRNDAEDLRGGGYRDPPCSDAKRGQMPQHLVAA